MKIMRNQRRTVRSGGLGPALGSKLPKNNNRARPHIPDASEVEDELSVVDLDDNESGAKPPQEKKVAKKKVSPAPTAQSLAKISDTVITGAQIDEWRRRPSPPSYAAIGFHYGLDATEVYTLHEKFLRERR
jgi:hypothetical protein